MPKYRITVEVESVHGWQAWEVEAATPEEALKKHLKGEGEFAEEEIEVRSLARPTLACVEEVESGDVMMELIQACEDLITAMVQLGKEHHREVAAARAALAAARA